MTTFNVGTTSAAVPMGNTRKGGGMVFLSTADNALTFQLQGSVDGVTWYTLLGKNGSPITVAVTSATPMGVKLERHMPAFLRVKCTVAAVAGNGTVQWERKR